MIEVPLSTLVPVVVAVISLAGVFGAAFIASTNVRRQIRSSHMMKACEMKQSRLDALRDTMATFQSYGVTPELNHVATREFYETGTKLELLMDPDDEEFGDLQACLYKFLEARSAEEKFGANSRYVEVCQRILRRESLKIENELLKC